MFQRFTDAARRVVVHAREEARSLGHRHIGTEHLLLGLLRPDSGGAAHVLTAAGLTLDAARREADAAAGGERRPAGEETPFTARAKKVLELSLREALQLGHDYIAAEHILLGLLREGEGTGAAIVRRAGADPAALRRDLVVWLHGHEEEARPGGAHPAPGGAAPIERRLAAIEERLAEIGDRLERVERLLSDGSGPESA